mmetsp:Transcript_37111/g.64085  ORF Transcript_37111/g.64085 Transcript_37111/m.64085 type:complete len:92 (+) Transcript_37111:1237-1512(+)
MATAKLLRRRSTTVTHSRRGFPSRGSRSKGFRHTSRLCNSIINNTSSTISSSNSSTTSLLGTNFTAYVLKKLQSDSWLFLVFVNMTVFLLG